MHMQVLQNAMQVVFHHLHDQPKPRLREAFKTGNVFLLYAWLRCPCMWEYDSDACTGLLNVDNSRCSVVYVHT